MNISKHAHVPRKRQALLLALLIPAFVFLASDLWWRHIIVISSLQNISVEDLILNPFKAADIEMRKKVHYSKYNFLWADAVKNRTKDWKVLAQMPMEKRCETFFDALDGAVPDWILDWHTSRDYLTHIDDKARFVDEKGGNSQEVTERAFSKAVAATLAEDQRIADAMTIIRNFGHCFLHPNRILPSGHGRELFDRYSAKVAPYLAEWSAEKGQNPLEHYYRTMKGAGIVISAADAHVTDLVRLLYLLRALDNALPIQVMHRLDLLVKNQHNIMRAATALREEALSAPMLDRKALEGHLKYAGMDETELTEMQFPPQQVEIVNIKPHLAETAQSKFTGYNNKVLALTFTSFERVLLMDADAVPFVAPARLLELREFVDTGTLFFRDRTFPVYSPWIAANGYARLMPHRSSAVDMAMGIAPVTGKTMDNAVMRGWKYYQESGIVAFDRKKHFASLFTLLPLALWQHPVRSLSWGDKEMFWMAMAMAGNENYAFNAHAGASVGQLTASPELLHYPNAKVPELCSSHIGHIGADGTLLWMNGGFLHCKRHNQKTDRTLFPYAFIGDVEAMDNLYSNPLRVRHAIVAPELPPLHSAEIENLFSVKAEVERRYLEAWAVRKGEQFMASEPILGWLWRGTCLALDGCAYERSRAIGGMPKSTHVGKTFEFDEKACKKYDVFGALWLAVRNE